MRSVGGMDGWMMDGLIDDWMDVSMDGFIDHLIKLESLVER